MAARNRMLATPIREALLATSSLLAAVRNGLGALGRTERACIEDAVRADFADSLDLDAALRAEHAHENRWDYLLGHRPSNEVIGIEPHTAKTDQVGTVIRKKAAAKEHIEGHLRPGRRIARWLWVASGRVHFADTEGARRRLDQCGIQFVGRTVQAKHLPSAIVEVGT